MEHGGVVHYGRQSLGQRKTLNLKTFDQVVDPKMLPELTEEEKAAMNRLGDDFIDRILAGEQPVTRNDEPKDDDADCGEDGALAGSGADCFMNRAEEVDDETQQELDEREREILRLRYGLDRGDPRTLEEVGDVLHLTRERIRQIERQALSKLRHPSAEGGARDLLAS